MTVADLALMDLADEDVALRESVASVEADLKIYQLLTYEAIAKLAQVTEEHERLRATHHRLLDEYRFLRERTMRQAAAA